VEIPFAGGHLLDFDVADTKLAPIEGVHDDTHNPMVSAEAAIERFPPALIAPLRKKLLWAMDIFSPGTVTARLIDRIPGLTIEGAVAIYLYTVENSDGSPNLYQEFNKAMRSSNRAVLKQHYFPYLRLIVTAMRALKAYQGTEKRILYRGVNLDLGVQYPAIYDKGVRLLLFLLLCRDWREGGVVAALTHTCRGGCCVGGRLIQWEVTSCSVHLEALQTFLTEKSGGTAFTVMTIETSKAVDIRDFSAFGRAEGEFVLPPGTALKIDGKVSLPGMTMFQCSDRMMGGLEPIA